MVELVGNGVQSLNLNQAATLYTSIPCTKGYVFHEDGTGIVILRGITPNCFARYQINYSGNIALPEGATAGPIAVALSVNGETRISSRAIFTPAAAEQYGNVSGTAIITVPRGCCFSVALRSVSGVTDPAGTPAAVINLLDPNVTINRIA